MPGPLVVLTVAVTSRLSSAPSAVHSVLGPYGGAIGRPVSGAGRVWAGGVGPVRLWVRGPPGLGCPRGGRLLRLPSTVPRCAFRQVERVLTC